MQLDGYKEFLRQKGRKKDTIDSYLRIVIRFFKKETKDLSFREFEKKYNCWLNSLPKHQHLFVHKAAGRAYALYRFGKKIEIGYLPRGGAKSERHTLTQKQYLQLIALMHEVNQGNLLIRNLALMEIFLSTGLKLSVVSNLNIEQIDLENNLILLGSRTIPIVPDLQDRLSSWLEVRSNFIRGVENALFVSRNGKRMKSRLIQHTIESNSLPGFRISPEVLRHTFAKWLLEITEDKELVRKLLHVNQSQYLESANKAVQKKESWSMELYLYKQGEAIDQ